MGLELAGGAVAIVLAWLGYNKVQKVANEDAGESDAVTVLRREVARLAQQVESLSLLNASLHLQIINERSTCSDSVASLKTEVIDLKHAVELETKERQAEASLRKRGLLKTRSTD